MEARPLIASHLGGGSLSRWLPRGGLLRHALTLASGVVLAQVAMVLCSPILARIYGPLEFAEYALFAVFANLLAILATGRYEFALMVPEHDAEAVQLLKLALWLPVVITLLAAAGLVIYCLTIGGPLLLWSYLVPLGGTLLAWSMVGARWQAKMKRFRCIAMSEAVAVLITLLVQLGAGFWQSSASGTSLVIGQVAGRMISLPLLFWGVRGDLVSLGRETPLVGIWGIAIKYRRFPLFSCGSSFIGKANQELPKILMAGMFGPQALGFYSLGMRVLGTPAGFIGQTLGDAFFPKISESHGDGAIARNLIVRTAFVLSLLGLPPAIVLAVWAEPIFAFAFGAQWAIAGSYARLLLPLFLAQFAIQPIALSLHVFGKQRVVLAWQLVSLVLLPSAFMLGKLAGNVDLAIFSFAMVSAAMLLIYLAMSVHYAEHANPLKSVQIRNRVCDVAHHRKAA